MFVDLDPGDVTEGPLVRALVLTAAPLLVQNVVQVGQQLVDLLFLGRFSAAAVSGVALATPLVGLLIVASVAGMVGAQVLVAQHVGADEPAAARRLGLAALLAAGVLAVGIGTAGTALARPVLRALLALQPGAAGGGGTDQVLRFATDYVAVYGVGLLGVTLADTLEGVYLGWGDSRAALYMNVAAVGLNALLDPLLIFGYGPIPQLGAGGAAAATVVGYTVGSLCLGVVLVARGRHGGVIRVPRGGPVDGTPDRWPTVGDVRAILSTGLPIGGREALRQTFRLAMVALAYVAGGPAALAAYLVGARVATVAFVPANGLQQAAQSVGGQNVGADRLDRARRTTWIGAGLIAATLALVGVGQWLVPGSIVRAVAPELAPDAVAYAVEYLRILAYGYPALGALYLFESGFNAADRTRVTAATTLLQYGAVRVPIAAVGVLALGGDATVVFWAVTASNVAAAVGLGAYYRASVVGGMLRRASRSAGSAGD
jgi:putative MATE family efflux protein